MRKNLLEFLFGDAVVRESSQQIGEQVLKLFEEAADEETDEMVATKEPLAAALKSLGINNSVDSKAQACEMACTDPADYRRVIGILFDPENMAALASKGWVPVKHGDAAMSFEPAEMRIGFIEIATADAGDSDKAPDLEKVLKDAQKFASTEVEHDDDNPVEFGVETGSKRKGVGSPKAGAQPKGTPKGAANESKQSIQELGGHWCMKCKKACSARFNDKAKKAECPHCGEALVYPKSASLRFREARKEGEKVAESLLEMTSTGAIPACEAPAPVMADTKWKERLNALRKRRNLKK